jgi:glycosyltransferase involved in cell wall biosynthesis
VNVLHLIASVDPRGGGPMEALRQHGLAMRGLGHTLEVASLDDPADPCVASYPLKVHALGPGRGKYRYGARLLPWLRRHAGDYDVVVVNGLWQYHGLAAWRALRGGAVPYVVFTHGMLAPWFKREYPLKHLKKWLYWPWAEYRVLRDAAAVLFTSEEERQQARESFWLYRAREQVVSYGTAAPPADGAALARRFLAAQPALQGRRLLLFLGRIHPKKGCDLLIDAYARVASQDPRLHLVMAGPDEVGWVPRLQARAAQLGIAERITWPGMLQGDAKWGAFHAAEAFVLPSHNENFGIAVAEALGCGLPVLISDQVNIWREIEADGAGLVTTDTAEGTQQLLQRWLALDAPARARMAERARQCFERRYTAQAMCDSLLGVYRRICRPDHPTLLTASR